MSDCPTCSDVRKENDLLWTKLSKTTDERNTLRARVEAMKTSLHNSRSLGDEMAKKIKSLEAENESLRRASTLNEERNSLLSVIAGAITSLEMTERGKAK